jgi:hypothetical protein
MIKAARFMRITRIMLGAGLVALSAPVSAPALAETPSAQKGQTYDEALKANKERIASLRQQVTSLRAAADIPTPTSLKAADAAEVKKYDAWVRASADKVSSHAAAWDKKVGEIAAACGASCGQLLNATKQMQETQMSFNMQYLAMQNAMQNENQAYVLVSNIMKTKHDTVKNSISNVR